VFAVVGAGEPMGIRFRTLDGRTLAFDATDASERESDQTEGGGPC
jgi:hypothetical protein